jgi:hypothetical protein
MSDVQITRIDNFVCPACGEVIPQVAARDGIVKGWCPQTRKEIKVSVNEVKQEEPAKPQAPVVPLSYLDNLKEQRAKVLKDVVAAREDGDLKENSAYHAARDQMSILEGKILQEEERIKKLNRKA